MSDLNVKMKAFLEDGDAAANIPLPTKEEGAEPDVVATVESDQDDLNTRDVEIVLDVTRDTSRTITPADELCLKRLENLAENRLRGYVGQEDFVGLVANALSGIGNIVGHLVNLIATGIFDGWRDFKRSELAEYCQSNAVTIRRIYSGNDNYARDAQVPHPQGMKGKYGPAIKSLKDFLDDLSILKRMDKMISVTDSILADMHKQNPSFSSHVKEGQRIWISSQSDRLFAATGKIFTTEKDPGDSYEPFNTRFDSLSDFEACVKATLVFDTDLRSVAGVHSRMENLEAQCQRIVEDGAKLDANQVKDIATMLRAVGTALDHYATVIKDVNRVNHNLVYCFQELRKTLGM